MKSKITYRWIVLALICGTTNLNAQQKIFAHLGAVNDLEFSSDGTLLLTCGQDNNAILWNVIDGSAKLALRDFTVPVKVGSISPNGKLIATYSDDKWLKVWNSETGEMISRFAKDESSTFMPRDLTYSQLEFANNEDLIGIGSNVMGGMNQLNSWKAKTGQRNYVINSNEFFVSMDVFDNGNQVITNNSNAGASSSMSIYDLNTKEKKSVLAKGIGDQYVTVSPDGRNVAMAGRGDNLTLFDAKTGKRIYEKKSGYSIIKNLAFSDDNRFVVTASQFNVVIWDKNSGEKIKTIKTESDILNIDTNGKLMAIGMANGQVWIYDNQFDYETTENNVSINKSKGRLALEVLGAEPMIVFERGIHQARVPSVKYTADGQQIITASWDKTIRIWDAESGEQERVIRVPSWKGLEGQIFDMDVSSDKKFIIAAGASLGTRNEIRTNDYIGEYVLLIDYKTGKILDANPGHNQTIQRIAFSPDGKYVVSGGGEVDSRVVTFKVDKANGKLIKSAERNMAYASNDFYPSCSEREFYGGLCSDMILGVDFVPVTNEVISIDVLGMLVKHSKDLSSYKLIGESLNRKTAGSLGKISNNSMFRILSVDPLGRYVAAGDYSGLVTLFDLNNPTPKTLTKGQSYEKPLLYIPSFGTYLMAMTISADGSQLALASDNIIRVYDIKLTGSNKNLNTPVKEFSHKEDVMGLAFSPDGKSLISTGMNPEECFVWNLNSGEKVLTLAPSAKFELLSAVGTNPKAPNEIAFGRGLNSNAQINYFGRVSKSFDLAKLEIKKIKSPYAYKTARELARGTTPPKFNSPLGDKLMSYLPLGNGHTIIGSSYGLFIDHYNSPLSVDGLTTYGLTMSSDKKRFITGLENGLIRMFKTEDGSEVASLFVNENDDWVLWTPDGYYTASLKGAQSVAWQTNLGAKSTPGYYPFEQFDLILNRPDLVLDKLGGADPEFIKALNNAYLKRLRKMDIKEEDLSASLELPTIEIDLLSQEVNTSKITVPVRIQDKNGLKRLFVHINDVPVYGQKGLDAIGTGFDKSLEFELNAGINKIQFAALNSFGVTSLAETRYITSNVPNAKGHLYVVAIGVSDYQDNDFDLSYAAKDATDFVELMSTHSDRYNGFTPILIKDANATSEQILKVKESLMKTSVNDHVILFAAGHGLLDDEYNYYFATHDIDFYNPVGKGLIYEDLEGILDGIPARKKLMFIDACNSGEVDEVEVTATTSGTNESTNGVKSRGFKNITKKKIGLENSVDLMQKYFNDLRKGTGSMIISSASGVEFAFESPVWQNGVFTYALLEGLKSGNADTNKDGDIRISELRNYVFDRVVKLTNGKQHPTSRRENLEFDFIVW